MNNSKLILGTAQMGLSYGINNVKGKISLKNSINILGYAFDNGITTLDTAELYGNAHEIIGLFHQNNPNKVFDIITKLPHHFDGEIERKVDLYLKVLKINNLNTLMFHSFESYVRNIKNFTKFKRLKSDSKIKNIGVSVQTNEEIERVILNDDIDIIQSPFNMLDNLSLRGESLSKVKSKSKINHARSVFLQGLFLKEKNDLNINYQRLIQEIEIINQISKTENISTSKLAMSYCNSQKLIDNIIIGVDSIDQLKFNIDSLKYNLSLKSINRINAIIVQNKDFINPTLWK